MDARVYDAVKSLVQMEHKQGLKMVRDTEHARWKADFVETHPEAALWAIVSDNVQYKQETLF